MTPRLVNISYRTTVTPTLPSPQAGEGRVGDTGAPHPPPKFCGVNERSSTFHSLYLSGGSML